MHLTIILTTLPVILASALTAAANPVDNHQSDLLPRCDCLCSAGEIVASNYALTQLAESIDASVVAITANTSLVTAQQIPASLQSLTAAFNANLSTPTTNFDDSPPGTSVVRSWGLLANTVEELMYDYSGQQAIIAGTFHLGPAIYGELGPFNATFQEYAALVLAFVSDDAESVEVKGNTGNATEGIGNATLAYGLEG